MEGKQLYSFAKALEDRLYNIENSYGNSIYESPINVLQSRLIEEIEEIGLSYLMNYQTIRLGTQINIASYVTQFFSVINAMEVSVTPSVGECGIAFTRLKRKKVVYIS